MPLIIPRILGGLGNQLFSYAAARRLAVKNNADLALDDVSGFSRDFSYQRCYQLDHFHIPCRRATASERLEPFARLRRRLLISRNRRRPFERRDYIKQECVDFDPRLLQIQPRGVLYLEGYWQSEGYFKDIEATIRADLRIKPPSDPVNLALAAQMQSGPGIAMHLRFFDAPAQAGINNAPAGYYRRAVALMEQRHPGAHYYLFSDQPEAARAFDLPLSDERITCVAHNAGDGNAYADLWLMTLCRHFIIANSTFSWWGAWLGNKPGTTTIAPGFESREGVAWWGFKGLIPEGWIQC